MFTPESKERAEEYLRLYGAHGFVLDRDGVLGVMVAGNLHPIQGGPNVQINASDEEETANAIATARNRDAADLARLRADPNYKPAL